MIKRTVVLQEGEYKGNMSRKGLALFNQSGVDARFKFGKEGAWVMLPSGSSYHVGVHTGVIGVQGELVAVTNVIEEAVEGSQKASKGLSTKNDIITPQKDEKPLEAIIEGYNATDSAKKLMLEKGINPEEVFDKDNNGRLTLTEVKAYIGK